ncbi:menaquinone biosynthesis decarboxylase [Candidatus Chlamydia sanziniae]|uniref:UbiD family decarboxylase n=1 Tax=Candidatus Chlamydia sanziniae TaxID=1806891 RepID=A0A1A9HYB0_9CHLA|nr:menaquinone biosynthesis decarboxylase [Candidatus Chlamydia sanziniae]ANH79072.1 UbiD family decarboxylase [Candidatus Chlamydia sanziniae]
MSLLRRQVSFLRMQNQLIDVFAPVDPYLELAEIHRRVIENQGPALLFHNVLGSSFPVLTNFFGTQQRLDLLFSRAPDDLITKIAHVLSSKPSISTFWRSRNLLRRCLSLGLRKAYGRHFPFISMPSVNLYNLPITTSWPEDGGAFLTLPLVYTESPSLTTPNLGMYRMQRFGHDTLGLHFQIQKGGGMHLYEAEQNKKNLPVTVFLSGNPFLILSAIAPLPENISEFLLCTFLQSSKLVYKKVADHPHPLLYDAEFILIGEAIGGKRRPEGPFGDHFGYYSLQHDFPEFKCKKIYHRKDAIYPATVVGKPYQEDFYIGNKLQSYFAPLFPLIMPGVRTLKSYGEAGFHTLTAAVVKERYWRESLAIALRILGEGQLSLTKFLMLTDKHIHLEKFSEVLEAILERMLPNRDLIVFSETANDTLDYTGPALNKGSKAILMGIGSPQRSLPHKYRGPHLPGITNLAPFCRGCLVLETSKEDLNIEKLLSHPYLQEWPLIVITNNLKNTLDSEKNFLWHTFTRCAPATDLYARYHNVTMHRPGYSFPFIINALMKTSYPKEVAADEKTIQKVSQRWYEYFPSEKNPTVFQK